MPSTNATYNGLSHCVVFIYDGNQSVHYLNNLDKLDYKNLPKESSDGRPIIGWSSLDKTKCYQEITPIYGEVPKEDEPATLTPSTDDSDTFDSRSFMGIFFSFACLLFFIKMIKSGDKI